MIYVSITTLSELLCCVFHRKWEKKIITNNTEHISLCLQFKISSLDFLKMLFSFSRKYLGIPVKSRSDITILGYIYIHVYIYIYTPWYYITFLCVIPPTFPVRYGWAQWNTPPQVFHCLASATQIQCNPTKQLVLILLWPFVLSILVQKPTMSPK